MIITGRDAIAHATAVHALAALARPPPVPGSPPPSTTTPAHCRPCSCHTRHRRSRHSRGSTQPVPVNLRAGCSSVRTWSSVQGSRRVGGGPCGTWETWTWTWTVRCPVGRRRPRGSDSRSGLQCPVRSVIRHVVRTLSDSLCLSIILVVFDKLYVFSFLCVGVISSPVIVGLR